MELHQHKLDTQGLTSDHLMASHVNICVILCERSRSNSHDQLFTESVVLYRSACLVEYLEPTRLQKIRGSHDRWPKSSPVALYN